MNIFKNSFKVIFLQRNIINSKNIIHTILIICSISFPGHSQNEKSNTESLKPFRFIFSLNLFHNIKTEDALASTKILADKIKKNNNLKEDFEIVICNSEEDLIAESTKDFDFILATTVETLALRKEGKIRPIIVNQTQGSYGFIYYLITNKDNNIHSLDDLKNGNIKILSRSSEQVPLIWLDKILRDNKLPNKEKFFNSISYDHKPTNVVLPVFFNKITAAIISKPSFELICELNPQILKQANILKISEPLLFGILCFKSKEKDKEREKFIFETLLSLHNDVYGKQLLDMFNVENMIPFKEEYLNSFLKLYK